MTLLKDHHDKKKIWFWVGKNYSAINYFFFYISVFLKKESIISLLKLLVYAIKLLYTIYWLLLDKGGGRGPEKINPLSRFYMYSYSPHSLISLSCWFRDQVSRDHVKKEKALRKMRKMMQKSGPILRDNAFRWICVPPPLSRFMYLFPFSCYFGRYS